MTVESAPKLFDLSEKFQHLPHAPIIEAIIDFRCDFKEPLSEETAQKMTEPMMAGYAFFDSRSEIKHQVTLKGKGEVQRAVQEIAWKGVRYRSNDGHYIVNLKCDGFSTSRLHPYENWEKFTSETFRVWHSFAQLTKPITIERIGVRFINLIALPKDDREFGEYISIVPPKFQAELRLPFTRFGQQETMQVPNSPYAVNISRAVMPPEDNEENRLGVVLDIDVYAQVSIKKDDSTLIDHLDKLRWLKNKIFFGSVTEKALELMK